MITKQILRSAVLAMGLYLFQSGYGQVSTPNNVPFNVGTDYVGWNGGTTVPLMVRHNGNQSIDFYTDSIQRMQLWHSPSPVTIGSFAGIRQNGFLGISQQPLFFSTAPGPFSRIHLVDSTSNTINDYAQSFGYRPWQRNGVNMTGNGDQMYIGQKYTFVNPQDHTTGERYDRSDAVVQWSDNANDAGFGTDRFRLIFTAGLNTGNPAQRGSRSMEGLESFRIFVPNDSMANVGVGDFFRASMINGAPADPTERLHVNDGTIRIDSLVPDYRSDTLSRVLVTDSIGRIHWRPIATWPQNPIGGAGCEWERDVPGNYLRTAWRGVGTNLSCPEADWRSIIGTFPTYGGFKTNVGVDMAACSGCGISGGTLVEVVNNSVLNSSTGSSVRVLAAPGVAAHSQYGVQSYTENAANRNHAITATATNAGVDGVEVYGARLFATAGSATTVSQLYGIRAEADANASSTTAQSMGIYARGFRGVTTRGVFGQSVGLSVSGATSTGAFGYASGSPVNYGVMGEANYSGTGVTNYGVWGRALGTSAMNWAAYFVGPSFITATAWTPSDENLKLNIEPIGSAVERLMMLDPKTYVFDRASYPQLALPSEQQYGFLAQQLGEVFPEFVTDVMHPAEVDSAGQVLHTAVEFKAVNQAGLTPLLVAALKEQQLVIDDLRAAVEQLRQDVAACCANPDRALPQPGSDTVIPAFAGMTPGGEKLRIQPNPFNERTTVFYNLDNGGRTQLMANSADGKELRVLHEATLEKGDYQYEWNTAALAPGMYYVTLLVDGQPVVKKAVKVDR